MPTVPTTPNAARWSLSDLFRRSPNTNGLGASMVPSPLRGLPDAPLAEEGVDLTPNTEGKSEPNELDTTCEPSRPTGHDEPLGSSPNPSSGSRRRPGIPTTICFDDSMLDVDDCRGGYSESYDGDWDCNAYAGGSVALSEITPFTFGDEIAEKTKKEFLRRICQADFDAPNMTEAQYDELLREIHEEQRLKFKRLRAQMDMCGDFLLSSSDDERRRPRAVSRSAGASSGQRLRDCEPPSHWPLAGDEEHLGREAPEVEVTTGPVTPLERRSSTGLLVERRRLSRRELRTAADLVPLSTKSRVDFRQSYHFDHRASKMGYESGNAGPTTSVGGSSGEDISALIQTIQGENHQPTEMTHSKSHSELQSAMGVDRLAEEAAEHDERQGGFAAETHLNDGFRNSPPPRLRADADSDSNYLHRRRRTSNVSDPHLAGLRTSARSSMDNSLTPGLTSVGAKTYDSATKLATIIHLKLLVAHQQEEIDLLRAKMLNFEVLNRSLSDSETDSEAVCEICDLCNELWAENVDLRHKLLSSQIREADLRDSLAKNDKLPSQLRNEPAARDGPTERS